MRGKVHMIKSYLMLITVFLPVGSEHFTTGGRSTRSTREAVLKKNKKTIFGHIP